MGSGASKQIGSSESVISLQDSIAQSNVDKQQDVQDENEKAMEEHQSYLVCLCFNPLFTYG